MDGSSIFGSDLKKKFENPSGELALGQYQTDNLKSHNHVGLFVNSIEGQWGQYYYQGEFDSYRIATQLTGSTRSFYTGYTGEQETCPKSITVNAFIKINFFIQYESYLSKAFWQLIKPLLLPNRPIDNSNLLLEMIIKVLITISGITKLKPVRSILERILITYLWNSITKLPVILAGYSYRSAYGSDYSRLNLYSKLGKAGSRYSRLTRIRKISKSVLPEKITFLIVHKDLIINLNFLYLDLSPLYGSNQKQQNRVRTFKNGQLKTDIFADPRILLQPPGVDSMLINCGYYMKIIMHNSLHTILGLDQTTSEWYLNPRYSYNNNWLLQNLLLELETKFL
ncbi:heme peroxidase [Gigaspora rosea]|uniref:Heme peroxidase n=1 Tax=Gigaspora rosea TaxID=44941 RepID=A0A397VRH7_9GLOM|nr:heme peroxidase [Gigaspora rosea]